MVIGASGVRPMACARWGGLEGGDGPGNLLEEPLGGGGGTADAHGGQAGEPGWVYLRRAAHQKSPWIDGAAEVR